jgi:hypothetical protein
MIARRNLALWKSLGTLSALDRASLKWFSVIELREF